MEKQMPQVVVGCFIVNDKNEILLVHSYKWPGKWVVMGGHIEWGETMAAAAEREAMEEVGLKVKFVRVIEIAEFIFDPDFHERKHFIAMQSECKVVGDATPKIDNDEIQEARWFPLKDAAEMPDILEVSRKTIKKIITDRPASPSGRSI